MAIWTDPNVKAPYLIPPMRKKENPKAYLKSVI